MIREESGDLLASEAEALVSAVNTVGLMGKGFGRMFVWQTGATTAPRLVINFPTKRHWRSASRFIECMRYECTIGESFRCAQVST